MASGDTLAVVFPQMNEPPAATPAVFDTRNNALVLNFIHTSETIAVFRALMPNHYDGGGITIDIWWMSNATSGGVTWGIALERNNENGDDFDSDSFASERTATESVNATSGKLVMTSITFTDGAQMDSIAAGEPFRIKLTRKTADAGDDSTDTAQLYAMHLRET